MGNNIIFIGLWGLGPIPNPHLFYIKKQSKIIGIHIFK